jgi:hypothetical protein
MNAKDDKQDFKVQVYLTEYEQKLLDTNREMTGESKGGFIKRILRLYLKGELQPKEL